MFFSRVWRKCKTSGGMHPLARFETSGSGVGDSLMQGASMVEVRCLEKRERPGDTKKRCQARRAASSGGARRDDFAEPPPPDQSRHIGSDLPFNLMVKYDADRQLARKGFAKKPQYAASCLRPPSRP